jgi:aerobic-type carbon monoxide dehydrogenase small subunit (CoxS/CutS family)
MDSGIILSIVNPVKAMPFDEMRSPLLRVRKVETAVSRRCYRRGQGAPRMSNITLKVNGRTHTLDIDPATPLLYILRNDIGLQGPRFGCGLGQCGVCTVIINGAAVRSCILPVSSVKGEITTLEGLSLNGRLHPVQQAWIDEQVPQCGFCQNGQIMTAKAMLDKIPHPTDAQIRETMNSTLCRCMTHYRVQAAIKRAAQAMAKARTASGEEAGA